MRLSFLLFFLLTAIAVFFGGGPGSGGNTVNGSFRQAKAWLETVYHDRRTTLYCGARFTEQKRLRLPAGFATASGRRPERMTWEHAVPVEHFGRTFAAWNGDPACVRRDGTPFRGRKCARKVSREFRLMEADMHNLFPAVDAVNSARGNRAFAELPEAAPAFGTCPAKISGTRFEPPDAAKGEVARAALYMAATYPRRYRPDPEQRRLFEAWDAAYPPTPWECQRARRIERLQRNANAFVNARCQSGGLWRA